MRNQFIVAAELKEAYLKYLRHMVVAITQGPQHTPQYMISLVIGTSQQGPLISETSCR